jgi:hypothetical protein
MSLLLLRATAATTIRVISSRPVATKGHNIDLPISLTSLIEIRTDPHKYLLTKQHIETVTKGTPENLECRWMMSSSFCRAYTVDISSLYMVHFREAMLNNFIVGPLVSDPKYQHAH